MNPNTNPEKPSGEASSGSLKMKSPSRKAPCRCHNKVEGGTRIRLPYECARSVFQLCDKLGHRNPTETIEWILNAAKSSVDAVLEANPTPPAPVVQPFYPPPMAPFAPVLTPDQNFGSAPIAQSTFNGGFDLDEEIVKYLFGSF